MRYEEFVTSYSGKTDDELLRLRLYAHQLIPEACIALQNELVRRGINSPERFATFRREESERKKELGKVVGNLFLTRFGVGRWYLGKADKVKNSDGKLERFRTTVFILILYFPLIPTGTYVIEKKPGFMTRKISVVEKLPLDWRQVFFVWAVSLISLLAVIWLVKRI